MALRELVNDRVIEKLDKGRYRRIVLGPDDASPDTVVVPAQQGNFEAMFLREHRWAEIRIDHDHRRDSLKYLAVYQTAPESAITHIAAIKDIRKGQEPGKSELLLGEPEELPRRIELVPGGTIPPLRNIRYTTRVRLEAAQTLDDVWKPRAA